MSMLKYAKDLKRRVVQVSLEVVGARDKTVDHDFDTLVINFENMIKDMNECKINHQNHFSFMCEMHQRTGGAALFSFLQKQQRELDDARELAKSLARIYDANLDPNQHWPQGECELELQNAVNEFKEKIEYIHYIIRSSSSAVCQEQGINPLRDAVTKLVPEIEAECSERNDRLKDYDSYRNRLKGFEEKREQLENAGKQNTPAATDNAAEIVKFTNKVERGKETYEFINTKAKNDIVAAKQNHDQLLEALFISVVTSQAEFHRKAAAELEKIVESLPKQRVQQVKSRMEDYIKQGGVSQPVVEKTRLQIGMNVAMGKALPSELMKSDGASHPASSNYSAPPPQSTSSSSSSYTLPTATSTSRTTTKEVNPFDEPKASPVKEKADFPSNPFGGDSPVRAPPVQSNPAANRPPPPAHLPSPPKKIMVEALFDHIAEEEDELTFYAGDKVEVLESTDSGWWKGKCHGKEGLFPVNYVKS